MVSRPGSLAVLATLAFVVAVPTLRADDKDDVKQLIAVAAQKLEADYRDALKQAFDLGKKDPAKAADLLRDLLPRVEASKAITDARRKQMLDALTSRIEDFDVAVKRGAAKDTADIDKEIIKRSRDEQQKLEEEKQQDFQQTLARIRKLKDEGKTAEANALAEELARRRGRTAETTSATQTTWVADQVSAYKKLQEEKGRRWSSTIRDVEKSAMAPIGDIEFPDAKKWKELTAKRKVDKLSQKEAALLKALNTPITIDLKDKSLQDVLDAIQTKTGQSITINKETLDAAGVTYESLVSISVRGVSTRAMLKKMLGSLGLTFVIKDESIVVMTPQEAKDATTVRVYYLGDIAALVDFRFPAIVNQQMMAQSLYNLMEMIQSIEPSSWKINGGAGTIAIDPRTMSLIVKQSAEMHFMLSGALR